MTDSPSTAIRPIVAIALLTLAAATAAPAVEAGPTFSKVFTPNVIGPGSVSTITFTITNPSGAPVTDLSFTDDLPIAPGPMTIADPANASTTCSLGDSGSLSAPDGGGTITLSAAEIGAFQSCTVTVDVTANTPGVHTNPAITLSSSAGSSMSLPIDLTVVTVLPGFSKSFAPSSIALGGRSTLTFTIDNTSSQTRVGNLDFTDNLPIGMVVADPANASTDCISASAPDTTLTAVPGSSIIALDASGNNIVAGFEVLPIGATCTVEVDVVATGTGELDNIDVELLADFVSAGKANATLEVTVTPVALTKTFTDDPVPPGDAVTLDFTIHNFDRNFPATGVAFNDDLTTLVPALAGLTFDSVLSNDCGGTVSGVGGTTIGLSGGALAPEGFCALSVSLSVPAGANPGAYTNTTSTITATIGGSPVVGNMAADTLYVEPAPILTKEFLGAPVNPGDPVVLEFTVTNTSTTSSATDVAFEDVFATVLQTASVTPSSDCCGAGSTCTFMPLFNPPPPSGVVPARLTISGGELAQAGMEGDSCTFSITLDVVNDAGPGVYPNTTSAISATVDGATRIGAPATDTLTVISAPILTKSFTDDPVAPGGAVTLEFTLSHSPDALGDATGITFTDDLTFLAGLTANLPPSPDPPCGVGSSLTGSAGDTLLTLMGGTLLPGEICTFNVTLDVPAGAAPGDYTNTTSGVGATVMGLPTTSKPATDDLAVAGLTFTKEFLGDPVFPGETLTLRFTIDNIHPTGDAASILFTDSLSAVLPGTPDISSTGPPSVDTCGGTMGGTMTFLQYTGGSVMSGQSCTIELPILVPAGAADGSYVNVSSNLTATQSGGTVVVDPAVDDLVINSNVLSLVKEFTDDPVAPGDPVTLEFNLLNLDAAQAASGIDFTDDLGEALPGLTFDSVLFNDCGATVSGTGTDMITVDDASLSAGGSCTIRTSLTVPGGAAASIYTNTTSDVTGMIGGFAVSGDAASDDLDVIQLLSFSKSFDGPTTATGMATLTFTITNPGTDAATDIEFTDDLEDVISGLIAISLPAAPCGPGSSITGVSFLSFSAGELPPMGGMCSFDVDVLVPATATAGAFPNTTSDLFRAGLPVADPATADLTIEPPPTWAKVFMPDAILAGGVSTLSFTIDNSASVLETTGLDFTDNLPAAVVIATPSVTSNSCGGVFTATAGTGTIGLTGGSVGAGASCTIDVDVTSIASGAHVNTTGDLTSSSGNSGSATDTLAVAPAADLSVTKSDGVTSATPGASVTYTIVAANAGPSADPAATLTDVFPTPPLTCTYTSVAAGGATGNTAAGAGDLAETLSMPAGSSVTYTAECSIDADATGTLSNTASITASVTDLVPGNNTATDDDTVLMPRQADLSILKAVSDDPVVSPTFTYTLEVTNLGPADADGVEATDVLPAGIAFDSSVDGCTETIGTVTCSFGTIAVNDTVVRTFIVALDAPWPATIINSATVSSDYSDPDSGNNESTVETTIDDQPPEVTEVSTAAGPLSRCDTARVPITNVQVTIVDDLALGTSVDDPANFLLVGAGGDADFSTGVCSGGVVGDDVLVEIVDFSLTNVDPITATADLGFTGALDPGLYRLLVCDSITDAAGNPLDGDGDATPGGDFVLSFFRVDPLNLFENGHFDDCPVTLDPWQIAATAPNAVLPGTPAVDDSAGSPFSSSARVYNSTVDSTSMAQCVQVSDSSGLGLRARVKFIPDGGEVATFQLACEFFAGPGCSGASLGVRSSASVLEDDGGVWSTFSNDTETPAGAVSALCDFTVAAIGASGDFDLFLDGLFVGQDLGLFSDGFESGDVSAWSSSAP